MSTTYPHYFLFLLPSLSFLFSSTIQSYSFKFNNSEQFIKYSLSSFIGIVTIKNRPTLPGKKETITFQFREEDIKVMGKGYKLDYWRELIMGKDSEGSSEFSGRKTVAFDPETGEQLVGGKRRKTRKQRKSRKGGKKSRKQRKSRKSSKKSHKRRTRKRRTR